MKNTVSDVVNYLILHSTAKGKKLKRLRIPELAYEQLKAECESTQLQPPDEKTKQLMFDPGFILFCGVKIQKDDNAYL